MTPAAVARPVIVGERVAEGFGVVEHREPMLSLANAFKFSELEAWYQRAARLAGTDKFRFVCEPKIDGLAVALVTVIVSSGWWVAIVEAIPTTDRPFIGGSTPSIADMRLAASLEFLHAIDYDFPAWAKEYMAAMESSGRSRNR